MMELVGCPINLHGYLSSGISKRAAQAEALDNPEKGKTATQMHIVMNEDKNYVKLDKPEYNPYHKSESHSLIQDGVKLILESVSKEKIKVNNKNQTLVQLKLRSETDQNKVKSKKK